jgi:hypothetical protein
MSGTIKSLVEWTLRIFCVQGRRLMTDGTVYEGEMADWMPHGRGRLLRRAQSGENIDSVVSAGLFEDGILVQSDG